MKTKHLSNQMSNPSNDSINSVTQDAILNYYHLAYTYAGSVLQSKRSKVTLNVVYVPFINLWE